ncbi:MAG TPA: hypothetical protein VFN94_05615, partial [Nitrospiria bacterium]|nr:hypothetical protein [Nitrospiria bacterium]
QYKRIIGVELSDLIYVARQNVDKMKHRRTRQIDLIQCDAQDFTVPSEVNVIYFYSPFAGPLLEKVTANIYASFRKTLRRIFIIYFNNDHFDRVINRQNWLTKIDQSSLHPHNSCGLYVTRP